MRSPITSHVLDVALGRPAKGVPVTLEVQQPNGFVALACGETNDDGRIADWMGEQTLSPGRYRVSFDTESYLRATGQTVFYPLVQVVFDLASPGGHYHIPLLLSPFGYSTYRGS